MKLASIPTEAKIKPAKRVVFPSAAHDQNRCVYVCGSPGSGKSHAVLRIINTLAHPKKTHIWWFSAVSDVDEKVHKALARFPNTFYHTEKDIEDGGLRELFDYLKQRQKEHKFTYKYTYNIVVFDDIAVPRKFQA